MSYAKRLDALKNKGYQFTVEAKYNFKSAKKLNVTFPDGQQFVEKFDSIETAIRFCEKNEAN